MGKRIGSTPLLNLALSLESPQKISLGIVDRRESKRPFLFYEQIVSVP